MNPEAKALISLVSSVLNQSNIDPSVIERLDFDALYKLAAFHQMTAIVAYALESAGIQNKSFSQAKMMSVRRNILFDEARKQITRELENSGIWYMSLKGVMLKDYYPQIGMRQMSDNDILFDSDRADDVKGIMESLGYKTVHFGSGHQDDYQKKPIFHFEMHRMLFAPESESRLYNYYKHIEEKLIVGEGSERNFTNEDFYIYMIAHEYKHFYWSGTGLRSLVDVYVFLQRFGASLDWKNIEGEVREMGISDFEEKNRILALKVFGEGGLETLTTDQKEMLKYFITSGIYGTRSHNIQNSARKSGEGKYILYRIFLPMKAIKANYPFFYKYKILLPILPIYRLIRGRKNAKVEMEALRKK